MAPALTSVSAPTGPRRTIPPGETALLTVQQVCRRTGFGKSAIRNWVRVGKFPQPIHIGRAIRWLADEVQDWITAAVAADREHKPARDR